MAKTRKPSRKDLKKDDEFVSRGQEVVAWASQYARQLVAAAVVLVLVVSISIGVTISSRSKEAAGATALGTALEIAERPVVEDEDGAARERDAFSSEQARRDALGEALQEVRREHSGTIAAAVSSLYLGRIAFAEDRHDDAIEGFEQYLKEAPRDHKLRFSALEGIGTVHEAREDPDAALQSYRRLVTEAPTFYVPFGLLHEARLLHGLGREDEARATAQRIIDEYGETPVVRPARNLLGRLPPGDDPDPAVAASDEKG